MAEKLSPILLKIWAALTYLFIYMPIIVLIVYSFNSQRLSVRWDHFTLNWYREAFLDQEIVAALLNSLVIAVFSATVSTIVGTLAALALQRYRFLGHNFLEAILYIPVIAPEVVIGISLLVFFSVMGIRLGLGTIAIAHVAFNIPFATLVVQARLHGFDRSIEESSMDLGANEITTFWRITLPLILPGVLSALLLTFTLSLDDYIVTYFTAGPGSTTLPLRVASMVRLGISPKINAISTLWILIVLLAVFTGPIINRNKAQKESAR